MILLWPCQEQMLQGLSRANYTLPGKSRLGNYAGGGKNNLFGFLFFFNGTKWDNWEKGGVGGPWLLQSEQGSLQLWITLGACPESPGMGVPYCPRAAHTRYPISFSTLLHPSPFLLLRRSVFPAL